MTDYSGDYDLDLEYLKKLDPFIEFILAKAETVSIYMFDTDKCEEVDCDIKGECFIYNRNEHPHFAIQISNREDEIYLREPIVCDSQWDIQKHMILYNKGKIIHSIMFHTPEDFLNMTSIFTGILDSIQAQPRYDQASTSGTCQAYCVPPKTEPNLLSDEPIPSTSTSGEMMLDKPIPMGEGSPKRFAETKLKDLVVQTMHVVNVEKKLKDKHATIKKRAKKYKEIEYCGLPAPPSAEKPKEPVKPTASPPKTIETTEIAIEKLEEPIKSEEPEPEQQNIGEALVSVLSNSEFSGTIQDAYLQSCEQKK